MSWPDFQCDEPDFYVRSIRDDPPVTFGVLRKALEESEIFRDMFAICDPQALGERTLNKEVLDLDEPADTLNTLLCLLHTPPDPPEKSLVEVGKRPGIIEPDLYEPGSVIPFPLLPHMLLLADKYLLSENTHRSLIAHVKSQVAAYPLKVYGFAIERGLQSLAADASKYLLHPPLSAYSPKDIEVVPTADAWHALVLLHNVRIRGLRRILFAEEIFPHGHGMCPKHKDQTIGYWKTRQMQIMSEIEAATDVATEMGTYKMQWLGHCDICLKAWDAAEGMLAYKCQKLPKSTYCINASQTGDQWLFDVLGKYGY